MRLNVRPFNARRTHEGAVASPISPLQELRRSCLASLLWEQTFYESGQDHAKRVAELVKACKPVDVASLAVEARSRMHLRHLPLFLVRELARTKGNGTIVAATLPQVIQRPDELGEYLAIYWGGKTARAPRPEPLSAGSKRGLSAAFKRFGPYALAKYDRDDGVKLRDVLRLTHAKPKDAEQAALWKKVVARELETPDTWEVALSAGKDKRETFERLLREEKLGALATLRNLRNMIKANVDPSLIQARLGCKLDKVLPFRFLAAVRHAPMFAAELDAAMLRVVADEPKLPGRTVVVVDVSGSMDCALSARSEMTRVDAAAGLAVLVREIGETVRVFSFSNEVVEVPSYRGVALATAIAESQPHGGTYLGRAVETIARDVPCDRIIVITDEQSHDQVPAPASKGYIINVGSYENGVGYGAWTHIDGWSERTLDFVREIEAA
jgi:60 kDa SS-A/Ro ribonucleoprotein